MEDACYLRRPRLILDGWRLAGLSPHAPRTRTGCYVSCARPAIDR